MLRELGEGRYGIYVLASLFAGWCGLLDFGLTTTTSRYATHYHTRNDDNGLIEVGVTALTLFGAISCLVFLLSCVAFFVAYYHGGADALLWGSAFFFSGSSFAVSKISDGYCGLLKGALHQELTGGGTLLFRILFGVVNFVTLYLGGGLIALFIGNFILTVAQLALWIALTRVAVPQFRFRRRAFRKSRVKSLFNYSFFAFLAQAGDLAVNRSDLIVIATFLSVSDVTRYNLVVVTLMSYFNSFLYETSTWEINWFTRLNALGQEESTVETATSRRQSAEFYAFRSAVQRASIYGACFLAFGILFFSRAFVTRWVGAEYLVAFPALATEAIAYFLYRGASETNARLLQGIARHQVLAYAAITHGVVNIVLSVLFLKLGLGLWGIALGTVIPGFIIYYLVTPNFVCRYIGESPLKYWRLQIKTTAIACLSLIVPGMLTLRFARPTYLNLTLLAFTCAAFYCLGVFTLGLTNTERRIVIRKVLERIGVGSGR
ncbi:MAG: hypothetical protein Q4G03_06000 [Planctomycetia bacterium]|nr:hypothetical protein [Planctomycetia bacterium]